MIRDGRSGVNKNPDSVVSQFEFLGWLRTADELQYIGQSPESGSNTSGHRWRHAEGFVNASKVIPHEIEGERMAVILRFLREGIGLPGKPAE
jgi:hypothetical protein